MALLDYELCLSFSGLQWIWSRSNSSAAGEEVLLKALSTSKRPFKEHRRGCEPRGRSIRSMRRLLEVLQ